MSALLQAVNERRIDKVAGGCWHWRGTVRRLTFNGRSHYPRRYLYLCTGKTIPKGLCVMPACSDAACVNPDHQKIVERSEQSKRHNRRARKLTVGIAGAIRGAYLELRATIETEYGTTEVRLPMLRAGDKRLGVFHQRNARVYGLALSQVKMAAYGLKDGTN